MKTFNSKNIIKVVIIGIALLIIVLIVNNALGNNKNDKEESAWIEVNTVKNFYNAVKTETMPLTELPSNYSIYNAIDDGCFRVHNKTYNEQSYKEFKESYNKKEKSFIRVAETTDEGDLILFDVAYLPEHNKVYIVIDNSRDKSSAEQDRKCILKEYEGVGEYTKGNSSYLVAYNGELSKENEDNFLFLSVLM